MVLHANPVTQNRPAAVRTGGIDRDDANRASLVAIVFGQLIDQRALTCAGRAGESQDASMAGMRE